MNLNIKSNFIKQLPADLILINYTRQVNKTCFSFVNPEKTNSPKLIQANTILAEQLGFLASELQEIDFLNLVSGNTIYPNTKPFAMAYAGHQFGNWAGQLGDGRAINLFELESKIGLQTLQLKGAGKTPYSRSADGLAVLRSSIREYLCAEAMYNLGVPTTRSLSIVETGNFVLRDILYNGNPNYEKGAIVCRVAPSFIRFGNFELLTSQNDIENLQKLANFTIENYFPEVLSHNQNKYENLFETIAQKSLEMVINWQRVGFVHGVMNTDNMSIHGITIDYGPYGWLENYDLNWTPNTTDNQQKRYRFGNQPEIVLWNLYQLANAFYPLINQTKGLEKILENFKSNYNTQNNNLQKNKLGLYNLNNNEQDFIVFIDNLLQESNIDFIIFYRNLSTISKTDSPEIAFTKINFAFYDLENLSENSVQSWLNALSWYLKLLQNQTETDFEKQQKMNLVNPKYVLRNYMAQLCIEAAEINDYTVFNEIFNLLQNPYSEQPESEKWFAKRPNWALKKVGCSMLSCSS